MVTPGLQSGNATLRARLCGLHFVGAFVRLTLLLLQEKRRRALLPENRRARLSPRVVSKGRIPPMFIANPAACTSGSAALPGTAQAVEKPSKRERVREHGYAGSRGKCCGIRLRGSAPKTPAGGTASCTSTFSAI